MLNWRQSCALTLALVVGFASGQMLVADEKKSDLRNQATIIAQLITQLGDKSFAVREAATKKLTKIGKPALAALQKATRSSDLEIRSRARRIIGAIQPKPKPKPKPNIDPRSRMLREMAARARALEILAQRMARKQADDDKKKNNGMGNTPKKPAPKKGSLGKPVPKKTPKKTTTKKTPIPAKGNMKQPPSTKGTKKNSLVPPKDDKTKRPRRPYLGISGYSMPRNGGVFVVRVVPGTAAARAGVRVGDIITQVGALGVRNMGGLTRALGRTKVGQKTTINVTRSGRPVRLPITIGGR